jgi:F-type H+-transporting ATPase subunit epsilon
MVESLLVNQPQFRFDLVAPEKVELSGMEERVLLPGEMGDFMVMAGHTQLLAGLRAGVLSVLRANSQVARYFISPGFADIGNGHCTVLTPHITPMHKLVADKIAHDMATLEDSLANDNVDTQAAQNTRDKIALLSLQLEAAQKYNNNL